MQTKAKEIEIPCDESGMRHYSKREGMSLKEGNTNSKPKHTMTQMTSQLQVIRSRSPPN
jgi:hypothetical protein